MFADEAALRKTLRATRERPGRRRDLRDEEGGYCELESVQTMLFKTLPVEVGAVGERWCW